MEGFQKYISLYCRIPQVRRTPIPLERSIRSVPTQFVLQKSEREKKEKRERLNKTKLLKILLRESLLMG